MTSVRLRVRTGPASRTTTPRLQRGVPQGEGRAKTQRLNGQPIRDRASLPQLLGLSCACVIFDPWQRAKTTRGGEIHRPLHGSNNSKSSILRLFYCCSCLPYYKHFQHGNKTFIITVQHDCIEQIRNVLDEQWGEVITET